MPVLDNNTFDKQLGDKLQDHETEYSAKAWENMQVKLDNAKKPLTPGFKRSVTLLSLLLLLLSVSGLTGYEFFSKSSKNDLGSNQSNKSQQIYKSNKNSSNSIEKVRQIGVASIDQKPGIEPYIKHVFKSIQPKIILRNKKSPATLSNSTGSNNLIHNQSSEIVDNQPQFVNKEINQYNDLFIAQAKGSISTNKPNDSVINNSKPLTANNISQRKEVQKPSRIIDSSTKLSPIKRTISFGAYVGADEDVVTFYQGWGAQGVTYPFGIFINYPITDKLNLQSGLGYQVTSEAIFKNDTAIVTNDIQGKIYRVTQSATNYIGYLNLPIILKYSLTHKFKICAGPVISYGLTAPVWATATNYKKNSSGKYQYANPSDSLGVGFLYQGNYVTNYNPNVYHFSLEMQLGIQWNMSRSFDLSFLYFRQLTNVLKTPESSFIQTPYMVYNNTLQLRLGYKLFSKRFHED